MYQKYASYQLTDFVADDEFIDWVRRPTPHTDQFWKEFLDIFPHQKATIQQARRTVRTLIQDSGQTDGAEEDARAIWSGIELALDQPKNRVVALLTAMRWSWAAVVALLCLAGAGWWLSQPGTEQPDSNYQTLVQEAQTTNSLEERVNTGTEPLKVPLPDGSSVLLEANSRISFVKNFTGKTREVYLTGAAFFEVTKNPEKPFLVYSNELVTKVLGTSFRIEAFDKEKNIVVSVRTGRVSVYAHKSARAPDPETTGLLLTPNQEVRFSRAEERFSRMLVGKPVVLLSTEELQKYAFEDAPVSQIFEALEKAYGVDIVYDEEVMSSCHLTTSLSAETLFDKLEVICEAIGSSYKVVDAQVVISSKGCGKLSE